MLEVLIHALPWGTITPITIMLSFSGLVWGGKLVPRSWVDKTNADKDARVHYLETALSEHRATIASLVQQNAELSASGRLSVALLQTLQAGVNHSGAEPGSEPHVPSLEK